MPLLARCILQIATSRPYMQPQGTGTQTLTSSHQPEVQAGEIGISAQDLRFRG